MQLQENSRGKAAGVGPGEKGFTQGRKKRMAKVLFIVQSFVD